MAGTPTVLSADNGLVTVPSSGEWTAQGIAQVQSLLSTGTPTTIQYSGGTVPTPTLPGGPYVLEVPNGTNFGAASLPSGYSAVIIGEGASGTVTGGDANTTILSAASVMSYSGNAGEVVETSTVTGGITGTINDSLAGAVFDLGGGAYTVGLGGNNQTIQVDDNTSVTGTISGSNDVIQLGDPTTVSAAAAASGSTGITNNISLTGRGEVVTVNSFGNIISDGGLGSTTIAGISGSSTIFAGNNDVYYGASGVTEFIAQTGAQTVFGGIGNDTVFNLGSAVTYNEGSGSFNIAVNASGSMSINGAGSGAVFGGTGSTALTLGTGNDVFVGGGGSDSIYGGNVNPTIFGGSNENDSIVGSHFSFVVADGSNSIYNATLTSGGDNFFLTGAAGNTTLVASSGSTGDTFELSTTAGGARTITIENWQNGDGLFLTNYDATDIQTMDNAIVGGATSFTLSDGTTVSFTTGNHPTHAQGAAIF